MIVNIIKDCIQILKSFDNIHVAHEYMEANQVAERLANWADKNDEMRKWINKYNILPEILELIERESIPGILGNIKGQL